MIKDIRLQKEVTETEKIWDSHVKARSETRTRPKTVSSVKDAELLLINCGSQCHTLPINPGVRDWLNDIESQDLFCDGEADGKDIDWESAPEEIRAYL